MSYLSLMATFVESVVLPSPFSIPTKSSSHSNTSSPSLSCKSQLPNFTALKSKPPISTPLALTSRPSLARRPFRIACVSSKATAQVLSVTEETWKSSVLESDLPVLVEFWAPWCGPCRIIQSMIDELAKEYAGKLKFFKVNTDESPSIASDYGVRSIPTVIIFKNGKKKEAIIGAVPKLTLTNSMDKFL